MSLQLTNHTIPGALAVIDTDTGKEIAYSKVTLHLDHNAGYILRATIDLSIMALPILNSPISVDAELQIEIGGKMYRVTPID